MMTNGDSELLLLCLSELNEIMETLKSVTLVYEIKMLQAMVCYRQLVIIIITVRHAFLELISDI